MQSGRVFAQWVTYISHVVWDCCVCGVVSQAIERLYARSCRLRLLCLWYHISFWRLSVYTHGHVVWDCCVSGVISHSGDRALICTVMSFETVVFGVAGVSPREESELERLGAGDDKTSTEIRGWDGATGSDEGWLVSGGRGCDSIEDCSSAESAVWTNLHCFLPSTK